MIKAFWDFTARLVYTKTGGQFIIPIPYKFNIILLDTYIKNGDLIINFKRIEDEKCSEIISSLNIDAVPKRRLPGSYENIKRQIC